MKGNNANVQEGNCLHRACHDGHNTNFVQKVYIAITRINPNLHMAENLKHKFEFLLYFMYYELKCIVFVHNLYSLELQLKTTTFIFPK